MSPATTYSTSVPVTDNDFGGNLAAYLYVYGNLNWAYFSNSIYVSNTLWSSTPSGGTALTNTLTVNSLIYIPSPTLANPNTGNFIYFGMTVPGGTPPGNYMQTITFNNLCTPASGSNTNTISANVFVQGACYTSLSPNTIAFGTVYPGSNTLTNMQVTDSDIGGDVASTIYVESGNWVYGTNSFYVTNAVWNPSSQSAFVGNAITLGFMPTNIIIAAPTQASSTTSNNVYFGIAIPGGTPSGLYANTITLENSC